MTDDELRQACEKLVQSIVDCTDNNGELYAPKSYATELVSRFARQQQAVGVRMVKMANRQWIMGTLQTEKNSFIDWCEAKAKELEEQP